MTDVDHDQLRAAINTVMAAQDIDNDGDIGGGWGAVLSASQPTALGLVRLVARDIEHASTQED